MRALMSKFGIAGELIAFLWIQKLWWMIPIVALLLVLGGLMIFAQTSAVAPFIYTLF